MADRFRHRLSVDAPLGAAATVTLSEAQAHFLLHVVRMADGDSVALFNGRDGEWQGVITHLTKRSATITLSTLLRPQTTDRDLWLCFAPIKGHRIDTIVEKATELGVCVIQPVLTERTVVSRVNLDRFHANAREAAEQSERLSLPEIRAPLTLEKLLAGWEENRTLIHCDERGSAPTLARALRALPPGAPSGILIGPEGGFAPDEQRMIAAHPQCLAVTLGPRILRADTAAIAAMTLWQAHCGDWR